MLSFYSSWVSNEILGVSDVMAVQGLVLLALYTDDGRIPRNLPRCDQK